MKNKTLQTIKVIILSAILVIGVDYVQAQFQGPTGTPPNNNVDAPVNVGTKAQVKNGGLSVNEFAAFSNAFFAQTVSVGPNVNIDQSGTAEVKNLKITGIWPGPSGSVLTPPNDTRLCLNLIPNTTSTTNPNVSFSVNDVVLCSSIGK